MTWCKRKKKGCIFIGTPNYVKLDIVSAQKMKRKREEEENMGREDEILKRRKVIMQSLTSSSPPQLAFDNALLPLASYNDDEEEEDDERRDINGGRDLNNNKPIEENDGNYDQEEDEEEDDYNGFAQGRHNRMIEVRRDCPYLDIVNHQILDFDFEKFCSFSLSNLNVYACLVCGKYFQGRGQKSHAYRHILEADHHVYINLRTEKVYCLPDGYDINDPSLEDIRHVLNPRFSREQVDHLDKYKQWSRALDGSD